MALKLVGTVALPAHAAGGFDHGDVHRASGRVFVAHTANDSVEVLDGPRLRHEQTLPGCVEGSGVLVTDDMVWAAARGAGRVVRFNAQALECEGDYAVGPMPNGLAWDPTRGQLLVADVKTFDARLIQNGIIQSLPGRPRWCVYDAPRDRFLVNIREPACVVALNGGTLQQHVCIEGLAAGPHGLDLDTDRQRAYVACDASVVCVLDLETDREIARLPIAGEPDAVWYSPSAHVAYVAIAEPGVIDVVDGDSFKVMQQVTTQRGAHTTAFDRERRLLYVFLPETSEAAVYAE